MAFIHFTKEFFLLIIYFFSISLNLICSKDIIRIPFGLRNLKSTTSQYLSENIFQNIIYINLTIGTPPQNIPSSLEINCQTFYLPTEAFDKKKSSTFYSTSDKETDIKYEEIKSAYHCTDILHINGQSKHIHFLLAEDSPQEIGNIGLLAPNKVETDIYPFFQSLNKAGIISSYSWTLKYFQNISLIDSINGDKPIGEFIFGDDPHNYENNKNQYDEKYFHKIPMLKTEGVDYYDLLFNNIYITERDENGQNIIIYIEGIKEAELLPDRNFIVAPEQFFITIKNELFNGYFLNDCCREKVVGNFYFYIECDNDEKKFLVQSFPDLYFEHRNLSTIFNLTYKDLFIIDPKTNKYIFLIFSYQYNSETWKLGTPFLRKYQFVFNEETKTIGYYNLNKPAYLNNDEDEKPVSNFLIYSLIGVNAVVIIIAGIVVYFLFLRNKCCNKKKEMQFDDEFAYKGGSIGVES